MKKYCVLAASVLMLPFSPVPTFASDLRPSLITFGPSAAVREGDHDYGQLIHVSVPEGSGRSYFRVFDADVGGAFDERYGAFDTKTSFKLYGAGASSKIVRDENGIVGEKVSGKALEGVVFGNSKEDDNAWRTVFAIDAERGELKDGQRHFLIDVRGVAGNDGNVFSVGLTTGQDGGAVPKGSRLYSNLPTFQVPRGRAASGKPGGLMSELRFTLPKDAKTIAVENFDAAGAKLYYAGPFNSIRLTASGTNDWQRDTGRIDPNEAGKQASITVANGYEKPNDMTVFVGVSNGGVDPVTRPLGIDLPLGVFAPNKRPKQTYTVTALGCQHVAFDASGSFDPDGQKLADDSLRHSWVLRGGLEGDAVLSKEERAKEERLAGERVERKFATPGIKKGRLESFDRSGLVGSGTASDFEFLAKAPPVASFTAPSLVGEGETFRLDGSSSKAPELPPGTKVLSYRWEMGDGRIVEQGPDDNDFGKPEHRYDRYGNYTIGLTVTDTSRHPCRTATTTKTITVNAPPTADAGGDRKVGVGDDVKFRAPSKTDPEGQIVDYTWTFGDGGKAKGGSVSHQYKKPGQFKVTQTADDQQKVSNSVQTDTAQITVNAPPSADGVKIPTRILKNFAEVFDARPAVDPDGKIARYTWRFSDGLSSTKPSFRRSFETPGDYDVELELDDGDGLSNSVTKTTSKILVRKTPNIAPVAVAGETLNALVGEVVKFDGSQSSDRDGAILSYTWDFGDGQSRRGINPTHAYRLPGLYKVVLTVEDDSGEENSTATSSFDIVVTHAENSPPRIKAGGDRSSFVGEIVEFDATPSTDIDGSLVAVEWDFGDGARASGKVARHTYRAPGEYVVSVQIRDDSSRPNAEANDQFTVSVTHKPNQAPVSNVPTQFRASTRFPVVFDATVSNDPDGKITYYGWTFGDGHTSNASKVEHTYVEPGLYRAELELRDDSGLENGIVKQTILVQVDEPENFQPVARAGNDIVAKVGQSIVLDAGGSQDTDGNIIDYVWALGDGRTVKGQRPTVAWFEPGNYTVKLTVGDGAKQGNSTISDTLAVQIVDADNKQPTANIQASVDAAIGEKIAFSGKGSTDSDGSILSFDWDMKDGTRRTGRDVVHAFDKPGTYDVVLGIKDDSGLPSGDATTSHKIRVNDPPIAEAGTDQFVTASQVFFDGSGSFDRDDRIISYQWDFGDGLVGKGPKPNHVYDSPGTYEVQLTVTDDSGTIRNTHSDMMTVVINALPIADAGFDVQAVPGERIQFDGSRSEDPDGSISRFAWRFGDGNSAEGDRVEHIYEKPGIYLVELTVLDDSGHPNARDFSQLRVTVNDPPVAKAGPDITVAPSEDFVLSAKGSTDSDGQITGWRWDVVGANQTFEGEQIVHAFEKPGYYTISLTVTDDSEVANATARDELIVHVNHKPSAVAGPDITSDQLLTVFDARGSADPDNDGLTYKWDFGDGASQIGSVVEHAYKTGGVYPVRLTVTDGHGLSNSVDTDTLTVRINRAPKAVAGKSQKGCVGDVFVFDGSSSSDPDEGLLRYNWDFGDGKTSTIVNPTKVFEAPGTYRVRLGVTDESGLANATHTDEAQISVLPAPVARAGEDMKVCAGSTVRFDATKSSDVDGVVNRFSWDFGDGNTGGGDRPEHTYSKAGKYRVSLQIEGDNLGLCSPTSNDDLIVNVVEAPIAKIAAPLNAAAGVPVTFDGRESSLIGGSIASHRWDFGDGNTAEGAQVQHVFEKPGLYRVKLEAGGDRSVSQCAATEVVHIITVNAAPISAITGNKVVEVDQDLLLSAEKSRDPDGGISSFVWDFGDGNSAQGVEVRHTWREAGSYPVTLTVDDGLGLENSKAVSTHIVEVKPTPPQKILSEDTVCIDVPVAMTLSNTVLDGSLPAPKWDFGDGAQSGDKKPAHTYFKPGVYGVTALFPINRAGQVTMTPFTKSIVVNHPPVAIADAVRRVCPGAEMQFSASRSFDKDGSITNFSWDFGDGQKATGSNVSHVYDKPGRYNARLTVSDDAGVKCSTSSYDLEVTVNAPPKADAGEDAIVFIGGAVDGHILDGSRSTDADGDALTYNWVLSDGAEYEGQRVRAEFFETGEVKAELTVSDPHGLACSIGRDETLLKVMRRPSASVPAN